MSDDVAISVARAELGPITARAEYGGQVTYLTKHGHRAAAVVPVAAAQLLEQLEDLMDDQAVRAALASLEDGVEQRLPFIRRTPTRTS